MALTVTEANAVNVVLRYLAGRPLYPDDRVSTPSGPEFNDAVRVLATSAHKRLMAGVTRDEAVRRRSHRPTAGRGDATVAPRPSARPASPPATRRIDPRRTVRKPFDEWKAPTSDLRMV